MINIQKVILGCGNFGGVGSLPELNGKGDESAKAEDLLSAAKDLGINRFDTANSYGGGRSEEILGKWIAKQEQSFRSQALISTKVGNPFGCRIGKTPLAAAEIKFHVQNSLRRLNSEKVETLYLHEPDPLTALDDTLSGLTDVLKRGLVDTIGLSNVSLSYLRKFINTSDEFIRSRIKKVQNEFHFLNSKDRAELIPFLRSTGISYVAFSPLAGGLLSGKYHLGQSFPEQSRLALRCDPYRQYLNPEHFKKISEFQITAEKKGRTLAEEAFRFVLDEDGIDLRLLAPERRNIMKLLVLSAKEIENCVEHDELRKCMRLALKSLVGNFPRHVCEMYSGFKLGFMPAHSIPKKIAGHKTVSVIPENLKRELNPHQGLISLLDSDTGRVKAILDGSAVTALRTAAVSAAATEELSRKDSETLAVIGAGRQALEHILALLKVREIKYIRIFSRSENSSQLLINKLEYRTTASFKIVKSVKEAIHSADIIVTCTPSLEPFLSLNDVPPGVHINAIGACRPGFHEIKFYSRPGLKIYLDSKKACAEEASEISEVAENDIAGELGECFSKTILSRTQKSDITVFKSVGLGITDLFAADYFYHRALALGLGQAIEFSEGL